MLIRLLPEQVSEWWDVVREIVLKVFPEHEPLRDNFGELMKSVLNGNTQVWVIMQDTVPKGILITGFSSTVTGGLDLTIYALASFNQKEPLGEDEWKAGYETLMKFAGAHGCARVVSVTDEPALAQRAEQFGGVSRFILYVPVKKV